VYCLARCSRAVVDSGEAATGSGKCTVLSSGKRRVPASFLPDSHDRIVYDKRLKINDLCT
jgi:hypothetical protein